jgi:hypothetical protein
VAVGGLRDGGLPQVLATVPVIKAVQPNCRTLQAVNIPRADAADVGRCRSSAKVRGGGAGDTPSQDGSTSHEVRRYSAIIDVHDTSNSVRIVVDVLTRSTLLNEQVVDLSQRNLQHPSQRGARPGLWFRLARLPAVHRGPVHTYDRGELLLAQTNGLPALRKSTSAGHSESSS